MNAPASTIGANTRPGSSLTGMLETQLNKDESNLKTNSLFKDGSISKINKLYQTSIGQTISVSRNEIGTKTIQNNS